MTKKPLTDRQAGASQLPTPSPTVAVALACVAVHAREAISNDGHPFDLVAIETALSTPGVSEYLADLDALALLPVRRT